MENKPEGFDRANGQGQNHDTAGNVENVGNETLKQDNDDKDLAQEIPTVTPENDNEGLDVDSDTQEAESATEESASNKGKGPAGENL
jgi:hypothetical protein